MWRSLNNFLASFGTYRDLSPDLRVRRQVNRTLRHRPLLTSDEWHKTFWQGQNVSPALSKFVYTHLQNYSGLTWGRVQPGDRWVEDLHIPLVCWFDWQSDFCQAFADHFKVSLDPSFDWSKLPTVDAFISFLNHAILSVNRS
jgi:hypothetical protein